MKLLFLADYEAHKESGKPLTGLKWMLWLFGPFSVDVLDTLDELEERGELAAEHVAGVGHFYTCRSEPRISTDIRKIVDKVLEEYMNKPLPDILNHVYSLDIVKNAELGEELKW